MLRATKLRMIRLIGIDVDGTLLDSEGRLPDANRDAIHAAVAAGIHVALVTGRSYPFARPVADTLPVVHLAHRQQRRGRARRWTASTLARRLLDRDVARRGARRDARLPRRRGAGLRSRRRTPDRLRDDGLGASGPAEVLVAQQLAYRASRCRSRMR